MLLPLLMAQVEGSADRLADDLIRDIATNAHTHYLHGQPEEELRRRIYDLYHHLSQWLTQGDERAIEAVYRQAGKDNASSGVPLSEVLYATILVKRHLWNFITANNLVDSVIELYQQEEIALKIGEFFDRAMYHLVRGYETHWVSSERSA